MHIHIFILPHVMVGFHIKRELGIQGCSMTSKVEHGRHNKMEMYKVDFEESELQTIETARKYPITNPQWMPYLPGFILQVDKLGKKELLENVKDPWGRPLRLWYMETTDVKDDRGAEAFAPSWNEPCHWFLTENILAGLHRLDRPLGVQTVG